MYIRIVRCLLIAAALVVSTVSAHAQSLKAPTGPVILTVTGKIAQTNRGPFNPDNDLLFKNTHVTFERAASFDLAMIEGLGLRSIQADYPQGGPLHTFEGPLLRDVLKAAGANGSLVKVSALDGYTQEIPMSELEQWPIVLAVKRDGAYLALGGFGPSWVAFPRRDIPALADRNDDKWVWGIVHIAVE
jgi:hypothetical protein